MLPSSHCSVIAPLAHPCRRVAPGEASRWQYRRHRVRLRDAGAPTQVTQARPSTLVRSSGVDDSSSVYSTAPERHLGSQHVWLLDSGTPERLATSPTAAPRDTGAGDGVVVCLAPRDTGAGDDVVVCLAPRDTVAGDGVVVCLAPRDTRAGDGVVVCLAPRDTGAGDGVVVCLAPRDTGAGDGVVVCLVAPEQAAGRASVIAL